MGGNALLYLGVTTVRLPKAEYKIVEREITRFLLEAGVKFAIPRYSSEKPDFGDLDIIYESANPAEIIVALREFCNSTVVHRGGNVTSFDFLLPDRRRFQIDLILSKNLLADLFYLSDSGKGQLVGMMARTEGLRFGGNGLFFDLCYENDSNKHIAKITISDDPRTVCEILNLDPGHVDELFTVSESGYLGGESSITPTDIFDWLTASKYFSISRFLCFRSKHSDRKTESKLDLISIFLNDYLPAFNEINPDRHSVRLNKDKLFECFGVVPIITAEIKKYEDSNGAKLKFSGGGVSHLIARNFPDAELLQQRTLGEFMSALVAAHPNFKNKEWVLSTPQLEINRIILEFYSERSASSFEKTD